MRELKFRAWGNEFDRIEPHYAMYSVTRIDWMITGDEIYRVGVNRPVFKEPTYLANDYKLMQSTGLTDKNGVEIYEGDICEVDVSDDYIPQGIVEWSDEETQFEFKQVHDYDADDLGGWRLGEFGSKPLLVIGNIYENPELLK